MYDIVVYCMTDWLTWFIYLLTDWLTRWLVGWLAGWLTDWLTDTGWQLMWLLLSVRWRLPWSSDTEHHTDADLPWQSESGAVVQVQRDTTQHHRPRHNGSNTWWPVSTNSSLPLCMWVCKYVCVSVCKYVCKVADAWVFLQSVTEHVKLVLQQCLQAGNNWWL